MITWHVYPDGVHVWKDGVFVDVIPKSQGLALIEAVARELRSGETKEVNMRGLQLGMGLQSQRPSSGGAPPALILDSLSAGAAYSTRKLRTAYAGSAIRVRRSNDNVEADIGFSGNALDTAALTAHVGANSGFVVTWYDQSGNSRNVTNTTQANQPRIVNAGTIDVQNTKPSLFFNGTSHHLANASPFMWAAGAGTYFAVVQGAAQADRRILAEANSGFTAQIFSPLTTSSSSTANGKYFSRNNASAGGIDTDNTIATTFQPTIMDSTLRSVAIRDTKTLVEGFNNGTIGVTTTYTPSGTFTFNNFSIGALVRTTIGNYFSGYMSEIIVFTSALSDTDFNTVGASQGGEYGITVSTFPPLTAVERLAQINGTGDGGSSFAVGLGGNADWEDPRFLDRAKTARGWQTMAGAAYTAGNLDSEGALASLSGTDTQADFFFSSFRDGNGVHVSPQPDLSGRFRVTITGGASAMTGFGVTGITQINATTWEFDCDMIGNKSLRFTPTSFPIKATIVKTTDIAAHDAGGIFRQEFLDSLPSGGCFRFMDWMGTNGSPIVNWSDYPVRTSQKWNRIPFEVMLALCAAKSATPWFNIPHQATDAFITSAAEYVRDNFAGKARWELSNEIWNFQFTQATYFADEALADWGVSGGSVWLSAAGKRFAQMMQLINTAFTAAPSRVIGVIGGQAANSGLASAILDAPQWLTSEPGSYIAPHTLAKEWSIAPYINWAGGGATTQGNAIKTQLDISSAAAVTYFKGMFPASVAQAKGWIDSHVPIAADRDLRLTMYEYNNHYDLFATSSSSLWSAGSPVAGALDVFIEGSYSQEMADAQDELRAYFKAQNGSLMAFFVDTGRASRFGTWGAKTHNEHNSLIWDDLLTWHAANTRWWAQ